MARKFTVLAFGLLLLDFAGCQMAHKSVDHAETPLSATALLGSPRAMYSGVRDVHPDISRRFIAIRHKLEILSTDSELPKSLESVLNFCRSIQCELIASNLTARTPDSSASGSIAMRVSPQDFPKLFAQAEKQGNIVQHITETEDKTSEVVDTEAKLRNLTVYRDNLRAMLGKPGVTVEDLVEIQEKLTDVQSQLDSETATRKILVNETEKIGIEINFLVERTPRSRSGLTPIWQAIRDSGSNLGESLATLTMVVVAVIPWIVVIVPTIWLVTRIWRKFRFKRSMPAPSPSS